MVPWTAVTEPETVIGGPIVISVPVRVISVRAIVAIIGLVVVVLTRMITPTMITVPIATMGAAVITMPIATMVAVVRTVPIATVSAVRTVPIAPIASAVVTMTGTHGLKLNGRCRWCKNYHL
jgi:hypothetical protein